MTEYEFEKYLEKLTDEELVFVRNRVTWECKRRIAEGNTELKSGE